MLELPIIFRANVGDATFGLIIFRLHQQMVLFQSLFILKAKLNNSLFSYPSQKLITKMIGLTVVALFWVKLKNWAANYHYCL